MVLALWALTALVLGILTGEFLRSTWIAVVVAGAALGVVVAVMLVAYLPSVLPQLVTLAVARREGFDAAGVWIGPYWLHREGSTGASRLRLTKAADGEGGMLPTLVPKHDCDLRARLIRVWRTPPIVLGLIILSFIPLGLWLDHALEGSALHGFALLQVFLLTGSCVLALVASIREGVRSPRSIVLSLRRGDLTGQREVAYTAVHGYVYRGGRPRDGDPEIMRTLREWVLESPTTHMYRYVLLRYLFDTG